MSMAPGIYNIPAGVPFMRCLAAQLLQETKNDPGALAGYRILLPTRRAARILREAFLQQTGGAPLLLPRMQTLGDIDEEELSLAMASPAETENLLNLPPALLPLRRQVLLAQAIAAMGGYAQDHAQAMNLAASLGRLMDQVYTEGLDIKDISAIAPPEFAAHWQISLQFLSILAERWPEILKEQGVIDAADRRDRLIRALALHWQDTPPQTPVIAAGSTGSIPATALLLQVVAKLPQGRVVVPGLDMDIPPEDRTALGETHPQYGLQNLLQQLKGPVQEWPCPEADSVTPAARRALAGELMRPASSSAAWTDLGHNKQAQSRFGEALRNLHLVNCANEREEAAIIALAMRQSLETKHKTAALITPDRVLARRVAAACRRWGIEIDDSAGQPLTATKAGSFFRLLLQASCESYTPVALLALLKHPLCRLEGLDSAALDHALRGIRPAAGIKGLRERLESTNAQAALRTLRIIEPVLNRFTCALNPVNLNGFKMMLQEHIGTAEILAGPESLWTGDDGEAAAQFFANLLAEADLLPAMDLASYASILESLMHSVTVRPAYGTHPRLAILGQLEARMTDADLVILAGLNEGTWPPDPGADPWMSRPMRARFGLPGHERHIGLAAHDFVQGFCAANVLLTRAERQGGAPTVPARWLQRLETVLHAAHIDPEALEGSPLPAQAAALDRPDRIQSVRRPEPRPPVAKRPRELYVTRIETLMKDPYAVYARHVLKLKKLDPLEKDIDAAERGQVMHRVLNRFVSTHPDRLPPDADLILTRMADEEIAARPDDPAEWSLWKPRFEKIAEWLAAHEAKWRMDAFDPKTELEGAAILSLPGGDFRLAARADRIDRLRSGGAAIIDYKSGSAPGAKKIRSGESPQLALEGLILTGGGFAGVQAGTVEKLCCWKLSGGAEAGEVIEVSENMAALIEATRQGLVDLVNAFDDEATPYYSLPRPDNAPRFSDYKHLARVLEWTALGDSETEDAA